MSNMKLSQFGKKQDVTNTCPISETPVTRLSRILSKTSFIESSREPTHRNLTIRSEATWVPADIDESANQEAPTKNTADWLIGYPHFIDANETSNSQSSGYHSSSVTHSAPSLRSGSLISDSRSFSPRSSKYKAHCSNDGSDKRLSLTKSSYTLKRTQSCGPREWLTKRQRKQCWPLISGIAKRSSYESDDSSTGGSNSCPAVICAPYSKLTSSTKRSSLPPVGELYANRSDESISSDAHNPFTKFCLSPSKCDTDSLDNSFRPQIKKQRTESPCKSVVTTVSPRHDLGDNVPIENFNAKNPLSDPNKLSKTTFDFFRHHSTPTVSNRTVNVLSGTPLVRVDGHSPTKAVNSQEIATFHTKPDFSRCASVPVQSVETIPSALKESHHGLACCDDSWVGGVRPRALPVIDRTSSGLHCVSPDAVANLVRTKGKDRNIRYVIVDCRFPYEYEGGHIQGAINIFTHSDLVHEIFTRVPAQRPPGASGPPKLLGDGLARRLATNVKEPLSAPCELASPDDDDVAIDENDDGDESWMTEFGEQDKSADNIEPNSSDSVELDPSVVSDSEPSIDTSQKANTSYNISGYNIKNGTTYAAETVTEQSTTEGDTINISMTSNHEHTAFVVIFHCEFSSQRAPDLAAFLRSVDRYSNFHRYPFLYFPEIYVMKGGYSAFYGKHPRLCSPKEYVKMFHRDYRDHLRLYRRLTKRVSSACLACIRPRTRVRIGSGDAPAETAPGDHSFGLDFSANTTVAARPPLLHSPYVGTTDDATTSAMAQRSRKPNGTNLACQLQSYEADDDKENVAANTAADDTIEMASDLSEHAVDDHENLDDTHTSTDSLSNRRSSSDSNPQDKSSSSDSPLSLAETVVRVGHRVIAATLTSAAPSAEVVEALDKFHRRATLPIVIGLKRANTVAGMHPMPGRDVVGQKRPANNSRWNALPLCDLDNFGTPMTGCHKRANTMDCYTPIAPFQKEPTEQLSEGTPILNINRHNSEKKVGQFTIGSPTLDCFIASEASSRSSPRLGVRRSLSASPSTYDGLEDPRRLQF